MTLGIYLAGNEMDISHHYGHTVEGSFHVSIFSIVRKTYVLHEFVTLYDCDSLLGKTFSS